MIRMTDIPNLDYAALSITQASYASNAGGDTAGGVALFGGELTRAWYIPATAMTASGTDGSRTLNIVNAGTAGTGTTVMGSLNIAAALASVAPTAFTLAAGSGITSGQSWYIEADSNASGTILKAGEIVVEFKGTD